MHKMNTVILILSDARGTYIPRDFVCDKYDEIALEHCKAWGLNESNIECWQDAANPNSGFYWEAWDWILNNAEYIAKNGDKYNLHQDGDLWGLCYERMTEEEKRNFGFDE